MEPDGRPSPGSDDNLQVIIAPHEYFLLSPARLLDEPQRDAALRACFLVNVEQPGSSWFELAAGFAQRALGVFDISREGVDEFRRRGIPAAHAPLGIAATFVAPSALATVDRPVDVLLMGYASPRREQFIARQAEFFSRANCRVVLTDVARPRRAGTPGYVSGDERLRLLASSRILLNVHSTDRSYFESHRGMMALANGCLLITETSLHTEPLEAERHFLMAPLDELTSLCEAMLQNPARLDALAREGQRFSAEAMPMRATCGGMLDAFQRQRAIAARKSTGGERAGLWDLGVARAAVTARLNEARKRREAGLSDWAIVSNRAYQGSHAPSVSVVVTLYNYELHIAECLASVARSKPPQGGFELVVVDDASTDGAALLAERLIQDMPFPSRLIRKTLNTGLADARNVGFEHARGDAVFVLDADNWIYPGCLALLHAELARGSYAATYGLLQRFDEESGEAVGLLSMYDWSPADLVRGPYIDAMALLDRRAVLAVGGYATELIEHGWFGWEDYALWLALAEAGYECKLVPRVVGAYRVHGSSMLQHTNRSTNRIARHFHRRFRPLVERYAGMDRYFGFPPSIATDEITGDTIAAEAIVPENPEAEQLRRHIRQLEAQLADVYASKSWRVTAPLRFALRLMTGR